MNKRFAAAVLACVVSGVVALSGCSSNDTAKTTDAATDQAPAASNTQAPASSEAQAPAASEAQKTQSLEGHEIFVYCVEDMQSAFQEIADAFQQETGHTVTVTYGNADYIQSQINTTHEGDYFIAGSGDELEPVEESVASKVDLVKHIPVLVVAKDNPKGITCLADLANVGAVFIMSDPYSTPIGEIAKKALMDAGIYDVVKLHPNVAPAPQLAPAVAVDLADATITWKEYSDMAEVVETSDMDAYVQTVSAALLTSSTDTEATDAFSEFLASGAARNIWTSCGYEIAE